MQSFSIKKHWRIWIRGILGLLFGALFLWLSLRQTSLTEVSTVLTQSNKGWLTTALGCYSISMTVRIVRWQTLLQDVKAFSFQKVGAALLIGYAANNVLPARLGEVFRADFVGRRYRVSRSAIAASILLERVLDGLVVVSCLLLGRAFLPNQPVLLNTLSITGTLIFSSIFLLLWLLGRGHGMKWLTRFPPAITSRIQNFRQGLSVRHTSSFSKAVSLSLIIWLLEGLALWSVLKAVQVSLAWQQILTLLGVTSLSTLIPSAPGYVGTYQYAYAFTLDLFGYAPAQGIAAATAFQVFLFGSVTLTGIGLYLYVSLLKPQSPLQ
ncbi:MAG: flippase-like domain-containing protein [Leptolyngbyaceae cyanobacterium SL_5_9]|nr:flippase-like domain-containing protein [Leptolyngbyaceae cyanobacterium SL_5_9]NJO73338.1 flippase-like domain-containing protein [Leptolyngbyaceae cyanobacterium RM1_406_9]